VTQPGPGPDAGSPDPRLAAALAVGGATPGDRAEVLAALADARVFVAITATATGRETAADTGLTAESGAELAVVLLEAAGGARALPVFPDLGALRRWRLDVRPVPLSGPQACAAAVDEGAEAVLLDPGGAALALSRTELASLARGWVPVSGTALAARRTAEQLRPLPGPADPALVTALRAALRGEPLAAARLLAGPDGHVLGVVPERPLDPAALVALARRVVQRLGPALPPQGLDLAVLPAEGPGEQVLRARRFSRRGR